MHRRSTTGIRVLLCGLSLSLMASVPRAGAESSDVAFLRVHLEAWSTGEGSADPAELFRNLTSAFESDQGWCASSETGRGSDSEDGIDPAIACLRRQWTTLDAAAERAGAIDGIVRAYLDAYASAYPDASAFPPPSVSKRPAAHEKAPLPGLLDHLRKIRLFSRVRASKKAPDEFSPTLIDLLSSKYPKRIRGVGKVDPLAYILAKYSTTQIQAMGRAIHDTILMMTASSAKLVAETAEGEKTVSLDADTLSTLAILMEKYRLRQENKDPASFLYGSGPELEDALLAGILTGEVDSRWVETLVQRPELQRPKMGRQELATVLGTVATVTEIAAPVVIPFVTVGELVYRTIQNRKLAKREALGETSVLH